METINVLANLTKKRTKLENTSGLGAQISRDFGSGEAWEKEFRATGSLRGIGWAALDAFLAVADWDLSTHRFETARAQVHVSMHA